MTTHEILNIGFQKGNSPASDEYINGIVKVLVNAEQVIGVFITGIRLSCVKSIDELQYICKRVNAQA
ncbi:MAG TPA: hypothetical protein PKE30_06410 [Niabella sp.]|nr:hypothetical protein [Niabella sp.]